MRLPDFGSQCTKWRVFECLQCIKWKVFEYLQCTKWKIMVLISIGLSHRNTGQTQIGHLVIIKTKRPLGISGGRFGDNNQLTLGNKESDDGIYDFTLRLSAFQRTL